jgi:hypothetical protein
MREGSSPPSRFASFRANTAVTTVADASTTADVSPVLGHIRLMLVRRFQLFLRVLCDVRKRNNEFVGSSLTDVISRLCLDCIQTESIACR